MTPQQKRQNRIRELQEIVDQLYSQGKAPGYILSAITKRAHEMASKTIAREYIEEIVSRNEGPNTQL